HACPLYAAFLMQMHEPRKTRPSLAPSYVFMRGLCMQIHALYAWARKPVKRGLTGHPAQEPAHLIQVR
ncbi:hypothetical protein, partial [Pantoea sp. UBA7232]|uniref:hypothetical protein n=1 Tax=Pantoea sp. UBA7232 TaxID=1947045 RepID=UPI002595644A